MRNILVLNCGSSSVKYELLDVDSPRPAALGLVERIGMEDAVLHHHFLQEKEEYSDKKIVQYVQTHREAIKLIVDTLTDKDYGVVKDLDSICGIGHRVVHGGEKYTAAVYVTEEVKQDIKNCIELAPLHNPHNLTGIEACDQLIPNHHQVAVFDTAFHQTMQPEAYMYAFPYEIYVKYKVRKYGFHGTSHDYVSRRAAMMLKTRLSDLKIISCHLGNGASICAIDKGRSVDTSMGFTPLAGLIMGTRTGNFDPYVLLYLMNKEALSASEANTLINRHSGLFGISGISRDFREIMEKVREGHDRSQLAINMFVYRIKHFIGAYAAAMNGVDALIFTAGIGENSAEIRELVCNNMDYLGVDIDIEKNRSGSCRESVISKDSARVKIMCIPTNEELLIAMETARVIKERTEGERCR